MELPSKPRSLWLDTTPTTDYPEAPDTMRVQVAVLGGGIAGLTTAYLLKKAGLEVVVIEANRIVSRVTGNTTAKISALQETGYAQLSKTLGKDSATLYGQSQLQAISDIQTIVEELHSDCHFKRASTFLFATSESEKKKVTEEYLACKQVGLPVTLRDSTPLPFPTVAALECADQAEFHPREYLLKLAEQVPVYENTRVMEVKDGSPCRITTEKGEITADHVVVATHFPVIDHSIYSARMWPHYSYVLAFEVEGDVPQDMYISAADSSHTIRSYENLVIVSGDGHHLGEANTAEQYGKLRTYAQEHFKVKKITYRWSTHDLFTADSLPYAGKYSPVSKNLYVATGFNGWGMTNSIIAAEIIRDALTGKENPYSKLFSPQRVSFSLVKRVATQAKESMSHTFDRQSAPTIENTDHIQPGQGRIAMYQGKKVAIARTMDGELQILEPACPHLGCTVQWNIAEETWDCPCHGSRFKANGELLYGPAKTGLTPVKD